jgi:HK97 gp10 family phage protein
MPDTTFTWKLVDNRLAAMIGPIALKADQLVERTAQHVVSHMKISMASPKHGRTYGRGASKYSMHSGQKIATAFRFHRASAPGEAPAIDTGHLVNSIQIEKTGQAQRTITVGAGYALALELGTRRMAARPSMRPALEKEYPVFRRDVGKLVDSTR